MAKKQHFLIIDTETTIDDHVADFGAVICDRKGEILHTCGVLVAGIFGVETLFYDAKADPNCIWSKKGLERREQHYKDAIMNGTRMLASVPSINSWLAKAYGKFDNLYLTAYNLPFDIDKCRKTNIDLDLFTDRFCMWRAAAGLWGHTKEFRQFILNCHAFNSPTALGNMSYKTNAEIMARYIFNNPELPDEPHTALEDIVDYELPILTKMMKSKKSIKEIIELAETKGYNWKDYQVRDHFKPA